VPDLLADGDEDVQGHLDGELALAEHGEHLEQGRERRLVVEVPRHDEPARVTVGWAWNATWSPTSMPSARTSARSAHELVDAELDVVPTDALGVDLVGPTGARSPSAAARCPCR
jgi:hypothetical protein